MNGLKTIGHLVLWTLAGAHRQHDVNLAAEACGIADLIQLPRIFANSAYRRAVRKVAASQGATVDDRGVVVKIVVDDHVQLVHQFLLGTIANTAASSITVKGAEFEHLCATRFNKTAYETKGDPRGLVEVEDVPEGLGREIGDAILAEYNRTAVDIHYTAADLRSATVRALRAMAGIQVLDHGGLWFVPIAYEDTLQALQRFIESFPDCRLVALPQYDVTEVLAEVQRRSAEALDAQLAEIIGDLQRFAEAGNTKRASLDARVTAFDTLRDRVELYERLLGNTLGELRGRLDTAQEALLTSLTPTTDTEEVAHV